MTRAAERRSPSEIAQRLGFEPCAPTGLVARLGNRWTVLVISHLAAAPNHRARFSALKHDIDGVTQRMLTLTLRDLQRDGYLTRTVYPTQPPSVEYALTDLGRSFR